MAKKEKVDLGRGNEYDFEENWGNDLNYNDLQPDNKSKDRNPTIRVGKTVLREMGKTTLTSTMAREILKGALPPSFSVTLDNVDRAALGTKELMSDVRREAGPAVREFKAAARSVNRLFPKNPLAKKLALWGKENKQNPYSTSNLNVEDAVASRVLDEVFASQENDRLQDQAEKAVDRISELKYRQIVSESLFGIQNELGKQTAYTFNVQRAYQKKSLELRIRNLMVSRAALDVAQKSAVETSNLLRDVVKNTGLPEVVKQRQSEEYMRYAREGIFGKINQSIGEWTRNYRSNITQRAKSAVSRQIQNFQLGMETVNSGLEGMEMQRELLESMGIDPLEFAAGAVGNQAALRGGRWLGKRMKNNRFLKRTDGVFQQANYLFNNRERLLSEYGSSGQTYGRWHSPATNLIKDILRSSYRDQGTVRTTGLNALKDSALGAEDRKLRALEEIIPGYLSRILHSIDGIRTGDSNTPRTVFNQQRGTFTTFKESVEDTHNSLIGKDEIERQRRTMTSLVKSIDPNDTLSNAGKEAIVREMMRRGRTSAAFNPNKLINLNVTGMSESDKATWRSLLISRYGMTQGNDGRYSTNIFTGQNQNLNRDAGLYNYGSNQTVGIFNRAHALANTGGIEALIATGAVKFNNGRWDISPDYYGSRTDNEGVLDGEGGLPGSSSQATSLSSLLNGNTGALGAARFGQLRNYPGPSSINYSARVNGDSPFELARRRQAEKGNVVVSAIEEQTTKLLAQLATQQEFSVHAVGSLADNVELIRSLIESGNFGGGSGGAGAGEAAAAPSAGKGPWWRRALGKAWRGHKAVWNATGIPFRAFNTILRKSISPAMAIGRAGLNVMTGGLSGVLGRARDRFSDVYVQGAEGFKKVLSKENFGTGRYIDQATGKVISSFKDITGAVFDTVEQTQILSAEDVARGLFNKDGKRLSANIFGVVGKVIGGIHRTTGAPFQMATSVARGFLNTAKRLLSRMPDVYVAGERSPRLYSSKLNAGEYYQVSTGKIVRSPKDIVGDIGEMDPTTRQIRPVLLDSEIREKGIVDRSGKPIRSGYGTVGALLGGAVGGAFRLGKELFSLPWRAANGVVNMAGNALGALTGGGRKSRKAADQQTFWLKRIYRLLANQFTGQNPLEGLGDSVDDLRNSGQGAISKMTNWIRSAGKSSIDRANDLKDRLGARAGSWLNRLKEHGGKASDAAKAEKVAKSSEGGWSKLIWMAISGVGAVLGTIKTGLGKFAGWIKDLPKWLMMRKGVDALGDLGDVGGRGKKGGILRKTGRLLGKAGKLAGRGALAAGRFALGGVGTALRVGASVLGGLVSAPGLAIAAAVAGTGYLIYKGWQMYSNRMTPMREYRIAQYGADINDSEQRGKLLALEEAVLKQSTVMPNGGLKIGSLDFESLLESFDVELQNQRQVVEWMRWYNKRFVPVFSKNVQVLKKMDSKAKLTDAEPLEPGQRPQFARETFISRSGEDAPYNISASPFPGKTSIVGPNYPAKYRDAIIEKYADQEKAFKAKTVDNKVKASFADKPVSPVQNALRNLRQNDDRAINPATDLFYSPGDKVSVPGGITGNVQQDEFIQISNRIDDLSSIRVKTYGLNQLVKEDVNLLLVMESELIKQVTYNAKFQATFNGDMEKTFATWSPRFGVNSSDKEAKTNWMTWFQHRFLPTFLNFCAQAKKISPQTSPLDAWKTLKSDDLLKVANFLTGAKTEFNGNTYSAWQVLASPWPGRQVNSDASSVKDNLDSLREQSKKEVYQEKVRTQKEIDKYTFDGKKLSETKTGSAIQRALENQIAIQGSFSGKAADGRTNSYSTSYGTAGTSFENAGTSGMYGNELTHGTGTGGSINDLPQSKGVGWNENKDLIVAVARMVGVDAGALAAMVAQESGFDPTAKNDKSSAAGFGQFINKTWKGILPTLVKKYGVNPNATQMDARANMLATAEYMLQNQKALGSIGRPLTAEDLYVAHFLGTGGARKLLSKPDSFDVSQAIDDYQRVAKANPAIFNGAKTVGDFRRNLSAYLNKNGGQYFDEANSLSNRAASMAGDRTEGATATTPALPDVSVADSGTTPSVPAFDSKGELPKGSTLGNPSFTGSTDTVPTVRVPETVAPEVAAAQSQRNESRDLQRASVTRKQEVVKERTKTDLSSADFMKNSLEYQRLTSENTNGILEAITTFLGKAGKGGTDNIPANSKKSDTSDLLSRTSTSNGMPVKSGGLPFDTRVTR
ncbi:peptidoglycan hydrolase [Serratia phage vB_SmaS-Totoro]|nr:peptidoglycan hydrolase [Serratia phage vB_SmaS-Totoro]